MSATYLHELSDRDLLTNTRAAVGQERAALALVLRHLAEVEHRQLYAATHSSFFEYLTKGLHYSESAAQRRISATRLLREFPWIEAKIQAGALSLSNLSQASTFFRLEKKCGTPLPTEKKAEVLHALEGKSARDGLRHLLSQSSDPEKLKAKRKSSTRPTADGRTAIRFTADAELMTLLRRVADLLAHVCPDQDWADIVHRMACITLEKIDPLKKAERAQARKDKLEKKPTQSGAGQPAQTKIQQPPAKSQPPQAIIPPAQPKNWPAPAYQASQPSDVNDEKAQTTEFASTADAKTEAQVSKFNTDIDPDSGEMQIRFPFTEAHDERIRTTSAEIEHAVFVRDHAQCTYVLPDGRRCGSQHALELDHIVALALGGGNTFDNLTIRCRVHNSYRARQAFGPEFIARKINVRKRRHLRNRPTQPSAARD